MRRVLVCLLLLLAAGCDSVDERPACARSSDCPDGQYCAVTVDGNVCWDDPSPPVVSAVTLTCNTTPCLRDGTLRVEATVTDDHEVAGAEATLDLDPSQPITLTRSGSRWGADVPLRAYPFEAFERPVVATVAGTDGARTTSAVVSSGAVQVTRLRWVYTATNALTAPAVMDDGTVVVGVANTSDQLLAVRPDGTKAWSLTVGTGQITAAPAIGGSGIWAGSSDSRLYRANLAGVSVNAGCASGGAINQASALLPGTPERAVAPSQASALAVSDGASFCNLTSTGAPATAAPAISTTGQVMTVAGSVAQSFTVGITGALAPNWTGIPPAPVPPSVGSPVELPLAVDGGGAVWSVATGGQVHRTTSEADSALVTTVAGSKSGAVFLSDGTAVIGTGDAKLTRPNATGSAWRDSATLSGLASTPLVLAAPEPALLVTTSTGQLFAVRQSDGSVAWSATLSATNAALQPANIFTSGGQPAGEVLSTAYVSGADGKLYAVIVDGELDTTSPWPKAFHDRRNTNNAGTQP